MVLDFVDNFFCKPILEYQGYNLVNTLVYGAIMLFLAFWVIYPFFNKKGVQFNQRLALGVLLFVLAGSSFRILEDLRLLPRSCNPLDFSFYTVTPGVYILFGLATIALLFVSLWLEKKTKKSHVSYFTFFGALLALPFAGFTLYSFKDINSFALIAGSWLAVTALAFFALRFLKQTQLNDQMNLMLVAGQALDGTATFVATQLLNCSEQHPVSDAILGFLPVAFILVKIAIALVIIHVIEKEVRDPNLRGFIKTFIIIIGFAPGIRDALTVGVGTCI